MLKAIVLPALLVVLGLSGCRQKVEYTPPKLYPVSGKVVAPPGKLPGRSMIQFTPKDASLMVQGPIAADGSFSLKLLFHKQVLSGATEGPHRVTVIPVSDEGPGPSIEIKKPYIVEPKENNFTIQLDR
jgi:hypothetical protein